jgi:hypothetical protein
MKEKMLTTPFVVIWLVLSFVSFLAGACSTNLMFETKKVDLKA